jgi:hypothetical protein
MSNSFTAQAIAMIEEVGLTCTKSEREFLSQSYVENKDRFFIVTSELYSSKLLERSLVKHADALVKSAEASEKYTIAMVKSAEASERHASSLTLATWVLAIATIGLVVATIVLVWATVAISK